MFLELFCFDSSVYLHREIVKMKGAKGKGAARNSREALKPVDDRLVLMF